MVPLGYKINEAKVLFNLYEIKTEAPSNPKFKIGDKARITKKKKYLWVIHLDGPVKSSR